MIDGMTREEYIAWLNVPQYRTNTRHLELSAAFRAGYELTPEELELLGSQWCHTLALEELRRESPGPMRAWALTQVSDWGVVEFLGRAVAERDPDIHAAYLRGIAALGW